MNLLTFYVPEQRHHAGKPLYEWLLNTAQAQGIHGGSAFRAIAGFGRHGKLREDSFFELAGTLAVKVEFILEETQIAPFLARISAQKLNIFYVKQAVKSGIC